MTRNYKDEITRFYEKVDARKIKTVDALLTKYEGKEEQLLAALHKKYGIPMRAHKEEDAPPAESGNVEEQTAATKKVPLEVPETQTSPAVATAKQVSTSYRDRLLLLYERYAPNRIVDIDSELAANKGREEQFLKALVDQYGAVEAKGFLADAKGDDYRERLVALYKTYAPSKLHKVDMYLRKYQGREASLLKAVETKLLEHIRAASEGANTHTNNYDAYKKRLQEVYKQYAPRRLNRVDHDLQKYPGREEDVIQAAIKKYGPPAADGPQSPANLVSFSNTVVDDESRATATATSAEGWGSSFGRPHPEENASRANSPEEGSSNMDDDVVAAEADEKQEKEDEKKVDRAPAKRAESPCEQAKTEETETGATAKADAREKAEGAAHARANEEARAKEEEELARATAEEEARQKAEEQAARVQAEQEAARAKAEEEARVRAEAEARAKAEQEAQIKAQQEAARVQAEQEAARVKAEEEARVKAEAEARAKAEQEAQIKAQQEAARVKAEEEARVKAEAEARAKAEQEAQIKAQQEAARVQAEQEAARVKAEEEEEAAGAKAEVEAASRAKAEGEATARADTETRAPAEKAARMKAEEKKTHVKAERAARANGAEEVRAPEKKKTPRRAVNDATRPAAEEKKKDTETTEKEKRIVEVNRVTYQFQTVLHDFFRVLGTTIVDGTECLEQSVYTVLWDAAALDPAYMCAGDMVTEKQFNAAVQSFVADNIALIERAQDKMSDFINQCRGKVVSANKASHLVSHELRFGFWTYRCVQPSVVPSWKRCWATLSDDFVLSLCVPHSTRSQMDLPFERIASCQLEAAVNVLGVPRHYARNGVTVRVTEGPDPLQVLLCPEQTSHAQALVRAYRKWRKLAASLVPSPSPARGKSVSCGLLDDTQVSVADLAFYKVWCCRSGSNQFFPSSWTFARGVVLHHPYEDERVTYLWDLSTVEEIVRIYCVPIPLPHNLKEVLCFVVRCRDGKTIFCCCETLKIRNRVMAKLQQYLLRREFVTDTPFSTDYPKRIPGKDPSKVSRSTTARSMNSSMSSATPTPTRMIRPMKSEAASPVPRVPLKY